ncbi:MAG: hypothetical protein GY953_47425, partial [bacterium]|nr:hypothetical protein [bacterium]
MDPTRELASWLISHRREIEMNMNSRLGPAAPSASSPEAEALRRFRSFVAAALRRGDDATPALDGLKGNQRRIEALIAAWIEAAHEIREPRDPEVIPALAPLVARFQVHLRSQGGARKTRGTPRTKRRAVAAAIDRITEAYFAIDSDTGMIE